MDSLLPIEWIRQDPNALIWSPTNSSGSPDHILYEPDARGFVIECKAVEQVHSGWSAPIDVAQLDTYQSVPKDVYYLLVSPPDDADAPWERECDECGGACLACPRDGRSLGHLDRWVANSPRELRFQPWFSHWAVLITARDLKRQTGNARNIHLDNFTSRFPGAQRFCHFLSRLKRGEIVAPPLASYGLDNFPSIWTPERANGFEPSPPMIAITGPN